ncbi:hypothetical protein [Weissella soli]|uniref:hypothetical protein n=3 Tax=Weissella soli TaxID=155866 RepID=UPI00359F3173
MTFSDNVTYESHVIILNICIPVDMIKAAWAKDSKGQSVPTHYVINGNTITQVIDFDENNFFPIIADPNWVKLGKHWYNKVVNVGKAIDIATIAAGVGFSAKSASAVLKYIKAHRANINRAVYGKIKAMLGISAASWVSTALDIASTISGYSIGSVLAEALDRLDGKNDNYVFA